MNHPDHGIPIDAYVTYRDVGKVGIGVPIELLVRESVEKHISNHVDFINDSLGIKYRIYSPKPDMARAYMEYVPGICESVLGQFLALRKAEILRENYYMEYCRLVDEHRQIALWMIDNHGDDWVLPGKTTVQTIIYYLRLERRRWSVRLKSLFTRKDKRKHEQQRQSDDRTA